MNAINLNLHRDLFRGEEQYNQFVLIFASALRDNSTQLVLDGERTIFTALSQEAAREALAMRIHRAILKDPALLDDIEESIHDDDLMDIDEL